MLQRDLERGAVKRDAENRELLTTEEAAELLRVTPETCRRWRRAGVLECQPSGRRRLIPRRSVEAYLEKRRREGK